MSEVREILLAAVEEHGFSGAVRVDLDGRTVVAEAFGYADRALAVPNTVDTRFGLASIAKGFTALTVVSLVADGRWELATPARALLGDDLPEIPDDVTLEHLLAHRSGIGDYLDETDEDGGNADVTAYVMPVPVHQLLDTPDYLPALAGHPPVFRAGERFLYCNSAFVVLALLVERVTGRGFHEMVHERVLVPAGMTATAYLRSDELAPGTARGYLWHDGLRTNVLHLPVRGSGDGGVYSTLDDLAGFWTALHAGRVVPHEWVVEMTRPRSDVPAEERRYGLGFWLDDVTDGVLLEGYDAGVSARTFHSPSGGFTWSVVSNAGDDAWPVAHALEEHLRG
jgi:CubicO group peptidase (beta-lactamase class C family)